MLFFRVSGESNEIMKSQTQSKELALEMGTVFNVSNLEWSIAGCSGVHLPNILSELKFNKISTK